MIVMLNLSNLTSVLRATEPELRLNLPCKRHERACLDCVAINSGAGIDFFVLADDEGRAGWICLMPPAAQKLSSAKKWRPEPSGESGSRLRA